MRIVLTHEILGLFVTLWFKKRSLFERVYKEVWNTGWYENKLLSYKISQSVYYTMGFSRKETLHTVSQTYLIVKLRNTENLRNAPLLNINQCF